MCGDAEETIVAILAGGAGTRVGGEDKGWLPVCGRPLIEHVVARARPQGARLLIAANRNIEGYARLAPVVHDEAGTAAGPLAGLVAVFGFIAANRHALPRWLLTVPVDCPDPPPGLAVRLRAAWAGDGRLRCARLLQAGRPEPLLAMYRIDGDPDAWLSGARSALREHGSPMRWQDGLAVAPRAVDVPAPAFHNLNTPADFEEFASAHAAP
jgi:molybdopterin-guanine dinucleotide biosynthesis protein A